jgi:hypothetical protein
MSYRHLGSAPSGDWGQIVTKDGFRYQITDEDVLWAARAAQCEGGGETGEKATLWTWTARFALPNYRARYPTLTSLIRAHSQPVNPIWARGGSKCAPGTPYYGGDRCLESVFATREACAGRSWEAISARVRDAVTKWATAQLPNPVPKSVDFASSSIGVQSGDVELARFKSPTARHYNVFYSEAASRARPADYVTVEHEGRSAGGGADLSVVVPVVGAIGIAAAAGFAFWAWKRSR